MSTYPLPQQEATQPASPTMDTAVHPEPNTGINSKKLGMWVFLASECMLFGSLIGTYIVYVGQSITGPLPQDLFNIPLTTLFTFVLLTSSLTVVLADQAAKQGNTGKMRLWLAATVVLGLSFLGFQVYEYSHFMAEGLFLKTNLFGSTFYILTGFHGVHVSIGVIWFLSLLISSLRRNTRAVNGTNVELAGLYWHFVDIVWIVVFGVVYLMAEI